jgi:outer membrane protein assembly factor BamE (lipoprotein component of BamABCDE complex)
MIPLVSFLVGLFGCDPKRIEKLEEGVSTEAEVRQQFGEPQETYSEPGGAKTFEYGRQPEGQVAYMITIGADGKMSALRQVMNPVYFAKITPGMEKAEVRHTLGRPARTASYALKPDEEHWEWRWRDGMQPKVFTVTFGPTGKVVSTAATDDPREIYRN